MNKLDITEEELEKVKSILQAIVPQHPVWAFGSRVKGTAKKFSDLDLAIITETPLSLAEMAELRQAFSESDLIWKVDIIDWATTNEAFRTIIQSNYIKLQ